MPDSAVIKDMFTACLTALTVSVPSMAELLHRLVDCHVVGQNMATNQQFQVVPRHTLRY